MDKFKFSDNIQELLDTKWKGKDIYSMSLDELKTFKEEVKSTQNEFNMLQLGIKTIMNAAYGASANQYFYFFCPELAADITGECRETTKYMIKQLENLFHEDIWNRKDLQEKFNFSLDESKHDWYRKQRVWIYSDTDSAYTTYGNFFKCWTDEAKKTIETDLQKRDWILKFNAEYLDKQNTIWLNEMYEPRNCKNIHNFELETISKSGIYLKKKKYLKELVYNNGKDLIEHPKISGTGIELIKSTTPPVCRKILKNLISLLLHEYDKYDKESFIFFFNDELRKYKEEFYAAGIDDISNSVSIGDYGKYIIDDTYDFKFAQGCPLSVKGIGRYNYLAHKNGQDNIKVYTGKIKYYYFTDSKKGELIPFGFPVGECPEWAPKPSKKTQWEKNVIDPINRFLEVMEIPKVNTEGAIQLGLFGLI